jgi:hypothetical protein
MSLDAVREHLTDVFKTGFGTAHPTIPVAWENQRFNRPANSAYVDFSVQFGAIVRANIGENGRDRHHGLINVQLQVPEDTGTRLLNEMSQTVVDLLKHKAWSLGADGKLVTCNPDVRSRPNINGYACRAVMIEFYLDAAS